MFRAYIFGRQFMMRPVNLTSAASIVIFAMLYGVIEHTLLTSPLGVRIFVYPLSVQLIGNLYFYHMLMLALAILVAFNPFFDVFFFKSTRFARKQGLMWGSGNIINFVWIEDLSYWVLFGEWPKDVMTPLQLSFYGVVWWYPVALAAACTLYYLTMRGLPRSRPFSRS
jgi:hypothetical protein